MSPLSESNMALLQIQWPELAEEGVWAHATPGVEQGGVLLATAAAPDVLQNEGLEQAVVLVAGKSSEGTVGLLLSKPLSLRLGRHVRGGLRFQIAVRSGRGSCLWG
jgi:hypothetical protein